MVSLQQTRTGQLVQPVRRGPVRQKHVEVTVEIVVAESCGNRMLGDHLFNVRRIRSDVGKHTVALVFVDLARVVVDAADKQVEIAVAIHVGKHGPTMAIIVLAAGTSVRDAGVSGIVFKQHAVALLCELIQIEAVRAAAAVRSPGVAIGNEQINVAVVVAIAGGRPAE